MVVAVAGCGRIGFDPTGGGSVGVIPQECDMRALQAGSPWPMEGFCPAHVGRSPLAAPTTEPTSEFFRMPGLELAPDLAMGIAIDADGTVYVQHGGANAEVFATDLMSPTPLWQYPSQPGAGPWTPTIGADGTVWMVCATNQTQWCGRKPSGEIVTVDDSGDVVRSSLTLAGDGLLRWIDANKTLHAVTVGSTGWMPPRTSFAMDGSDPAVALDGRTFINDDNGVTYVYDAAGTLVRMVDPNLVVPANNFGSTPVLAGDGRLAYAVFSTHSLVVVPTDLSSPAAVSLPEDPIGIAVDDASTLYVTDANRRLHVIRGTAEVGTPVLGATPPILAANHVLLVGANLDLRAYDTTQTPLALLWKHTFDTDVATVRLADNGVIVVATKDGGTSGSLRAIR